jgi:ribosomal protein L37AE/L43A
MAVKVKEANPLAVYEFHGMDLQENSNGQAMGECPFCGKDKFSVSLKEDSLGLWRCFVCNEGSENGKVIKGGNPLTFVRKLWEHSSEEIDKDWEKLRDNRGLLYTSTLVEWGVRRSAITGEWVIPGWNADGKMVTLYRYVGRPRTLMTAPGMGHGLLGRHLWSPKKSQVYLAEGVWDGMAIYEVLKNCKENDDGKLEVTANDAISLYADINVLAAPGATTFHEHWATLFTGKQMTMLYDSDHPRENGAMSGYDGMKRISQLFSKSTDGQPSELRYLDWGEGKGYDPSLPDGYDVRDWLSGKNNHEG